MKIILVAPKSISRHRESNIPLRFDYAFWNFYLPLNALGHETHFFDSSIHGDAELKELIERIKPDLLFCVMTGSPYYCPQEPWETIEQETVSGRTKTFNWFCDDSWRFDSFSSQACHKFNYCSTPEKQYVQKYKDIGYDNIMYATWHSNSDVYSDQGCTRYRPAAFVGSTRGDRNEYISALKSAGHHVFTPEGTSMEDMVWAYSTSLIGLNFSKNSTGSGTQMKARMFEVPATGAALVTEYTPDLENCFEIGKEILTFTNKEELVDCVTQLKNTSFREELTKKGYDRYRSDHESKIRLSSVLKKIQ